MTKRMTTATAISLAGGQGKSTSILFTARILGVMGYKVLVVDVEPQHSITAFLGVELEPTDPSLYELLMGTIDDRPQDCVYELSYPGLSIIPSDRALRNIIPQLLSSGLSSFQLAKRLVRFEHDFDFCLIDSPPAQNELCQNCLAASDGVYIPVEATVKGTISLDDSLRLIEECASPDLDPRYRIFNGEFLGAMPFRVAMYGNNMATDSRIQLGVIESMVGAGKMLPNIISSEPMKNAQNRRKTLIELGRPELEIPFRALADRIIALKDGGVGRAAERVAVVA